VVCASVSIQNVSSTSTPVRPHWLSLTHVQRLPLLISVQLCRHSTVVLQVLNGTCLSHPTAAVTTLRSFITCCKVLGCITHQHHCHFDIYFALSLTRPHCGCGRGAERDREGRAVRSARARRQDVTRRNQKRNVAPRKAARDPRARVGNSCWWCWCWCA
jgi:hypothetical protein